MNSVCSPVFGEETECGALFQNVADNMKIACDQLKNGTGHSNLTCYFNHEHFWSRIRMSSKKLSHEITKLSLIFSRDPLPSSEEVTELLNSLEAAYVDSLSTFYVLPKEQGLSLHTTVKNAILAILESVYTVVISLKNRGPQVKKDRLTQTGQVWEACGAIDILPQNNLQVLRKLFDNEQALVVDALKEIEEEVRSDSLIPAQEDLEIELSETWNNSQRALLSPCIGLVKTTRATLKKVSQVLVSQGKCDTVEQIHELDDLASVVTAFSSAVDDLIAAMYPPMTIDSLKSAAKVIVAKINTILKMVQESHYSTEDDLTWIDFLLKAADHNNNKLQQLLVQC